MVKGINWNILGMLKSPASKFSEAEMTERIRKKAQELWERRGRVMGKDLEFWLEAEKLVKSGKG